MQKALILSFAFLASVAASSHTFAQEHFGDFLDRLKGFFVTEAKPRLLFKLDADFRFMDPNGLLWTTPAGTEVDGASIPQPFWSLIGGPFDGTYINASVIHDHYCKTKERTAHGTHRNFYYGMRASNVPDWKAQLMHWAVSTFGQSWKLERRIVMRQLCNDMPGQAARCSSVPSPEVVLVTYPPVDLSDPAVLAAAVSKTNAVARTLLTSNGKILDITSSGPVLATLDAVEASATAYRQVFASKELSSSPARLGLLSQPTGASLADVEPWPNNRIPRFSDAVVLTPKTVPMIEDNAPYKLDPRSKDLIEERIDLKTLETTTRIRNGK